MPTDFPIFSPSRTVDWDRCSTYSLLRREGWESRQVTNSLLGRLAGGAFNEAIRCYHSRLLAVGDIPRTEKYADIVDAYLRAQYGRLHTGGQSISEDERAILVTDVTRAGEKYIATNPLAGYKVLAVEQTLPDYGNCRIDLVLERDDTIYVTDLKFKRRLDSGYIERTVSEYLDSWQMRHYIWAYGEAYGVKQVVPNIILVVGAPRFVVRHASGAYTPEAMTMWLQSAKQIWADMQAEYDGKRSVTMATNHRDQFGTCPYYSACFESYLDPNLMQAQYIKVLRETK